ncbi:MAG: type IV pilus secretin PilQ, partial [Halieaceae bacterium]|nr:type IV pilus secretin PilQ [Halieaceae bacterium]
DLGVQSATSGFAIGFTSNDLYLTAELSALEASGQGEVVSQPKIITGDKQSAMIKSGRQIPYQQPGGAGAAGQIQFEEAVLRLEVRPNITPDDRILLDLKINQDSVGELVNSGAGPVPSIDVTELTTQVLVGNGETIVLGGVFQNEENVATRKVPVLGDIPYVGQLFRSSSTRVEKNETLIFITPRILSDALLD